MTETALQLQVGRGCLRRDGTLRHEPHYRLYGEYDYMYTYTAYYCTRQWRQRSGPGSAEPAARQMQDIDMF